MNSAASATRRGQKPRMSAVPARDAHRPTIELREPTPVAQTTRPPASEATPTPPGKEEDGAQQEGEASPGSGKGRATGSKASGKSQPASQPQGKEQKSPARLPAIEHMFLIVLDDVAYAESFGPESKGRYLSRTLGES